MNRLLLPVAALCFCGYAARAEETLLFVDEHEVLYRSGTERVLHPATPHSLNPVVREDQAWEMAIGWTSIYRDPETGRYQLWYQAYGGGRDERKTHKCVVAYAESTDGIEFTKPSLGVHEYHPRREPWMEDIKDTNIVLLGGGGYGDRYCNSVLVDAREKDPAKRYKMLFYDFSPSAKEDGREIPGWHAAFSADGIHWKKHPEAPLNRTSYGGRTLQPPFADEDPYSERWDERKNFLRKNWPYPYTMSDAVDVFWDPRREVYAVYGKCWIHGPDGGLGWKHAMARSESTDFLHWSKPQIVCSPDEHDPPNTEFHTSPVFFHQGVYFSLNQILSARGEAIGAKADQMHIELMTSRDGLRWERPFRATPFIDGSAQAFSNGGIFTNTTPVFLDDEIRFYYGGYNSGAIGGGKKLTDPSQQSGVGFASIRPDRFAGIRPVALSAQSTLKKPLEHIGQITLKPRPLTAVNEILINGDASAEGASVRVEILNAEGYRMRGFSKDDAVPVSGDALAHRAAWKDATLDQLPPGDYHLRIHLDHAEVFALTLR
jgi:hypothetical protein